MASSSDDRAVLPAEATATEPAVVSAFRPSRWEDTAAPDRAETRVRPDRSDRSGDTAPARRYFTAVPHSRRKGRVPTPPVSVNGKPLKSCLRKSPPVALNPSSSPPSRHDQQQQQQQPPSSPPPTRRTGASVSLPPSTSPRQTSPFVSSVPAPADAMDCTTSPNPNEPAPVEQSPTPPTRTLPSTPTPSSNRVASPTAVATAVAASGASPRTNTFQDASSPRLQNVENCRVIRPGIGPVEATQSSKKKVRFAPKIYVRPTIHIADMPEKLVDSVWYTYAEYRAMKEEVSRTAKAVMNGRDLVQEEEDYHRRAEQSKQRKASKLQRSAASKQPASNTDNSGSDEQQDTKTSESSISKQAAMTESYDDCSSSSSSDSEVTEDEKADTFDMPEAMEDAELLCLRGCESKTKEGNRWRSKHKLEAWVAVLDEQDRQYDLGVYCDWNQLSYEYQMVTRPCTNRAIMQGMKDQQEIHSYMQDVRLEWFGRGKNETHDIDDSDTHSNANHSPSPKQHQGDCKSCDDVPVAGMEELNQSLTSIDLGESQKTEDAPLSPPAMPFVMTQSFKPSEASTTSDHRFESQQRMEARAA